MAKKLLAICRVSNVNSTTSCDVGCPFVDTINNEATLERGESLPGAMAESVLGLTVMQGTLEGVSIYGIRGEQLATAKLGQGGVCFEAEASF
jgi:hypothetical protein